jgi:hypothetical protein
MKPGQNQTHWHSDPWSHLLYLREIPEHDQKAMVVEQMMLQEQEPDGQEATQQSMAKVQGQPPSAAWQQWQ